MLPGYVTVHSDYDEALGLKTYRFEFPPGPIAVGFREAERAGIALREGRVTIGGRSYLAVKDDRAFTLDEGFICYPITDPRSLLALVGHDIGTYFHPLARWVAMQYLLAGWLTWREAFSWRSLWRIGLDRTISGPAGRA